MNHNRYIEYSLRNGMPTDRHKLQNSLNSPVKGIMKDWEYMKQKHRIPFWKTVPNEVNKSVRNFYHKF